MPNLKTTLLSLTALISLCVGNAHAQTESALLQFRKLIPGIEKRANGVVDEPKVHVGDINGDNRPDRIISYVVTPKGGGNMIIDNGYYIYLNTNKGMKAAGKFPEFKFCYALDKIQGGIIYINKYKCAPPYNEGDGQGKLAYRGGKIVLLN